MAQAVITINGTPGSNDDLPINTIVQLSNQDAGGEVSYAWTIESQPAGAADALSNPAIENPTFTPKKEGTYLLRLVVNAGPNQLVNTAVAAVRFIKSRGRAPAASETSEDGATGWALAMQQALAFGDAALNAEAGIIVAVNASGGTRSAGNVVSLQGMTTIKTGLPGQETVPQGVLPPLSGSSPATAYAADGPMGLVISDTLGNTTIANNGLMLVRVFGIQTFQSGCNVTAGEPLALDLSALNLVPTSYSVGEYPGRVLARALNTTTVGNPLTVYFDGLSRLPAPQILMFGETAWGGSAGTFYASPGFNRASVSLVSPVRVPMPYPGVVYGFQWRARQLAATRQSVITVQVDDSDTALVTMMGATLFGSVYGDPVPFAEGDYISLKGVNDSGAGSWSDVVWSLAVIPTRMRT